MADLGPHYCKGYPGHPHRFTVAVEWERRDRKLGYDKDRSEEFYFTPIRVTVLRCESCPEEIARG